MSNLIAQNERSYESEIDAMRSSANDALVQYLNQPTIGLDRDTLSFWRTLSTTTDKAQKCLCDLARHYLTPPPTSTGMLPQEVVHFTIGIANYWQCQYFLGSYMGRLILLIKWRAK